ncbi:hypothetical protein FXO38_22522 [Capsicum annuum]|nr:hypothetical protein FXO38_22522 [Capsicum annuum]
MIGKKEISSSLKNIGGGSVKFSDNARDNVTRVDSVKLSFSYESNEVYLVDGLKYNSLSINHLYDDGFGIFFKLKTGPSNMTTMVSLSSVNAKNDIVKLNNQSFQETARTLVLKHNLLDHFWAEEVRNKDIHVAQGYSHQEGIDFDEAFVPMTRPHLYVLCHLRHSPNSGELETLVLGICIIPNDYLFEKVFDTKYSGVVPFMNGTWPENFEVNFDKEKKVVLDPNSNSPSFGPLSLSFRNRILAHLIAPTLISQKGYLSNGTYGDMFVLYYPIKKYKINWSSWIREYMIKNSVDSHASASLSYGLLITQILLQYGIYLSSLTAVEVYGTYESKTFASMGHVLIKKNGVKRSLPKVGLTLLGLTAIEKGISNIKESTTKLLQLSKETVTDIGESTVKS